MLLVVTTRRRAVEGGRYTLGERREQRARALARQLVVEHRAEQVGAAEVVEGLRRRAEAAYRLPPVRDTSTTSSYLAAVDPWVTEKAPPPRTPSGMTAPEVQAEAQRLRRAGWSPEEIERVLALTGVPE